MTVKCNTCLDSADAEFYIVEPIGMVNFFRPVCTSCGTSHIVKCPNSSLVPLNIELAQELFYHLVLQALTVTTQEIQQSSPSAAHVRSVAKRAARARLRQLNPGGLKYYVPPEQVQV